MRVSTGSHPCARDERQERKKRYFPPSPSSKSRSVIRKKPGYTHQVAERRIKHDLEALQFRTPLQDPLQLVLLDPEQVQLEFAPFSPPSSSSSLATFAAFSSDEGVEVLLT